MTSEVVEENGVQIEDLVETCTDLLWSLVTNLD